MHVLQVIELAGSQPTEIDDGVLVSQPTDQVDFRPVVVDRPLVVAAALVQEINERVGGIQRRASVSSPFSRRKRPMWVAISLVKAAV